MANEDNSHIVTILAMVRVKGAASKNDASVVGGNIARSIGANIPSQYEVVGVEVQGVNDENDEDDAPRGKTTPTARRTTPKPVTKPDDPAQDEKPSQG